MGADAAGRRQRRAGLAGATAVAVSDDGQYVYVTSGQDGSLAVYGIQSDGTLVLDQVLGGEPGLGEPGALAVEPANGNVYVASQAGLGQWRRRTGLLHAGPDRDAAFPRLELQQHADTQRPGGQQRQLHRRDAVRHHRPGDFDSGAAQHHRRQRGQHDHPAEYRRHDHVNTGTGPNQVTANATNPNTTLTINGGGGNDSVELDSAAARDQITINLGNGNSTAQVEGTALDPSAQVTVNGGRASTRSLFDAQGQPITTYDASGNLIPPASPRPPMARSRSPAAPTPG